MYLNPCFELQRSITHLEPVFGWPESGFGEMIYYKHYSRLLREDGVAYGQETWHDTVVRVIEGVMSIRKDWYKRNRIRWDETYWQHYAYKMAVSLFKMHWMPPGRGLWAMGSEVMYERGAMPLYNCAFTTITDHNFIEDLCWLMDLLMNGVGVGFDPVRDNLFLSHPVATDPFIVPDTREGWVDLLRQTLNAFVGNGILPIPDYHLVRPAGSPIKTFGGTASGPGPLDDLYNKTVQLCYRYIEDDYDIVQFKTDLANLIGVCVISGNVRRSAEIACGEVDDDVFMHLKNYTQYPERASWGWMSNNSVRLRKPEDFEYMQDIAFQTTNGCDIGFINMMNIPFGRIGKDDNVRYDEAIGLNPCGEIPLENKEVCNLAETLPTRCATLDDYLDACEFATFYTSTVTLLPTHQEETNKIVMYNRRIGVSMIDFSGWKWTEGIAKITKYMRQGYKHIRDTNTLLAREAGIPESIRVTTVKPGGTVPKVPGRTSGAGNPTFKYTIRRVTFGEHQPIFHFLKDKGIPYETSVYTKNSYVFEFPIVQGPAEPATEISVWEQAMNVVLLQREWADNAVSNTLYYNTKEHGDLEAVLASIAPLVKSISALPHTDKGIFPQMPEEGITKEEYEARITKMPKIDWSTYFGGDGEDEKYCVGDTCTIVR